MLAAFCEATGIPVGPKPKQAKDRSIIKHRLALGAIGVTGNKAANELAKEADVVIVIGSRLNDFMTSSQSGFRQP